MKLRIKLPLLLTPLIILPLFTLAGIVYTQLRTVSEQKLFMEMQASNPQITGYMLESSQDVFAEIVRNADIGKINHDIGVIVAATLFLTAAIIIAGLLITLDYIVIRPLHRLAVTSRQIGRGNLVRPGSLRSNDEFDELAGTLEDISGSLRRSDEQIRFLAYHDSLTGLPNRAMFMEYLEHALAIARRSRKSLALLFLDVDDFKRVNDTSGHQAGDSLLQEVSERLSNCLRRSDYVARNNLEAQDDIIARLGGDEFIILLPDLDNLHNAGLVARRLIKTLSEPIIADEHEFYISASIGITLYPNDGEEGDALMKNADIAMYHAKNQGKNAYQYYQESMNKAAFERLVLENKLRKAVRNGDLLLHYQAQVIPQTGEIVGLEVLLRWNDLDDGMVSPSVFIPIAEETGLILPIGEWVLYEACRQARAWQDMGLPKVSIGVNLSSIQFSKQDLPKLVRQVLDNSKLDPRYLDIEITESAMITQPEQAINALREIKEMGVTVSLDDFGTGYSSLSYLRRFPIDTLKIDRSFIHDVAVNQEDAEIVSAIIVMTHALKLQVVAEGVENNEQLLTLVGMGCDIIQGYLFSRPLPADETRQLLMESNLASV